MRIIDAVKFTFDLFYIDAVWQRIDDSEQFSYVNRFIYSLKLLQCFSDGYTKRDSVRF